MLSKHKITLSNIAGILIMSLIFVFLGKQLHSNWNLALSYNWDLYIHVLIASFFIFLVARILRSLTWKISLSLIDEEISLWDSCEIISLSELAKYVPGKVWNLLGNVYLAKKKNISQVKAFTSQILLAMVLVLSGLLIFSVFLLFNFKLFNSNLHNIYLILIIIPIVIFSLHPKTVNTCIQYVLKKTGKYDTPIKFSFNNLLLLLFCSIILWFFYGLWFYIFTKSIFPLTNVQFPIFMSIYAISWTLGFLAIIVPSGLGIREGVLTYLLGFFMPIPMALAISILSRIWLIICDLLCAFIAMMRRMYAAQ
jgi:uncharacterized membrane protein YbhN (UPF0104 family)